MDDGETLREKQNYIKYNLKSSQYRIKWHNVEQSKLEELFARGSRSSSKLILEAFKLGCRLDAWTDKFQSEKWKQAITETGCHSLFQKNQESPLQTPLPWDHIDCGLDKQILHTEEANSMKEIAHQKCDRKICSDLPGTCPGTTEEKGFGKQSTLGTIAYPKTFGNVKKKTGKFIARGIFQKRGKSRYLSHLEINRIIFMAFNRAQVPVVYSKGFHPKPKISFFCPLPVGTESISEYMDTELSYRIPENELLKNINRELPEGIPFSKIYYLQSFESSLPALFTKAYYTVTGDNELCSSLQIQNTADTDLKTCLLMKVKEFIQLDSIIINKIRKGVMIPVNIRPHVQDIRLKHLKSDIFTMELDINLNNQSSIRPEEVITRFLGLKSDEMWKLHVCRTGFS